MPKVRSNFSIQNLCYNTKSVNLNDFGDEVYGCYILNVSSFLDPLTHSGILEIFTKKSNYSFSTLTFLEGMFIESFSHFFDCTTLYTNLGTPCIVG